MSRSDAVVNGCLKCCRCTASGAVVNGLWREDRLWFRSCCGQAVVNGLGREDRRIFNSTFVFMKQNVAQRFFVYSN